MAIGVYTKMLMQLVNSITMQSDGRYNNTSVLTGYVMEVRHGGEHSRKNMSFLSNHLSTDKHYVIIVNVSVDHNDNITYIIIFVILYNQ